MWWVFALLSAIFAALTSIFAKVGMKNMDPDLATAIRTCIVLVMTWMIVFSKNITLSIDGLTTKNWIFLVLSGVATGLSWLFYFRALQIGKVSQVTPVDKSSLAFSIILSVIFLGETLTWKVAAGTVLIIAGTLIVVL